MAHDFWVTIEGERGEEWKCVVGTNQFPIKTPVATLATVLGEKKEVYFLELQALDVTTRERIVAHLGQKFGMLQPEAERTVAEQGIPIVSEECSVTVLHPQRWFA